MTHTTKINYFSQAGIVLFLLCFCLFMGCSTPEKYLEEKQLTIITSTDNDTFEAKNYTVLVVDDEEQILELNSEVLNDVGFNVFSFDNAEEALSLLSRKHIDIIVTDVVMPKMGGVEFIRHAKALVPALKYLFVSGYVDEKNTAQAQDITPLLNQPYTRNEFITAIKAQCCNGDN